MWPPNYSLAGSRISFCQYYNRHKNLQEIAARILTYSCRCDGLVAGVAELSNIFCTCTEVFIWAISGSHSPVHTRARDSHWQLVYISGSIGDVTIDNFALTINKVPFLSQLVRFPAVVRASCCSWQAACHFWHNCMAVVTPILRNPGHSSPHNASTVTAPTKLIGLPRIRTWKQIEPRFIADW